MGAKWRRQSVEDLISTGRMHIEDGYRAKRDELVSSGLPFVRAGNINDGVQLEDADHLTLGSLHRVGTKISEPGDVVFTTKGSVGRLAFVRPTTRRFVYSPQLCFWRSLDHEVIDPRFLYYWMHGPEFRLQYKGVASQTDLTDYVSLADQRRMHITIPDGMEQRAIAHILGTLDDKIELNRRTEETLEAIGRALFTSWFVDFDPVRAKAEGRQPGGMAAETAKLFPREFVASGAGKIPKGWRCAPLSYWATVLSGATPPKGEASFWRGDRPWISPKDMTALHADEADAFINPRAAGNGARTAPRGSTLVMVRGMGLYKRVRVSHARQDVSFSQDVRALVPKNIEASLLLFAMLQAQAPLLARVESSGHGTGTLPREALRGTSIVMPPAEIQRPLSAAFNGINDAIAAARAENRCLAALRDELLPCLLSGRMPVAKASTQSMAHTRPGQSVRPA